MFVPQIDVLRAPPLPFSTYTSFLIIPSPLRQGEIYILSPLDRETKDHYTLTAVARDNPGGSPNNRRENSVQVEIAGHNLTSCRVNLQYFAFVMHFFTIIFSFIYSGESFRNSLEFWFNLVIFIFIYLLIS